MKAFFNLVPLSLLATCVIASPIVERANPVVYQLYVTSKGQPSLNGQAVEEQSNTLGLYKGNLSPVRVYAVASQGKPGLSELHTWPIGIVDHVLGLNGDGLWDLVDTVNIPSTRNQSTNQDTFKLRNGLVTQDIPGGWVSFPTADGGNTLQWYDGSAFVTEDYVPVDLHYTKVHQSGGAHTRSSD